MIHIVFQEADKQVLEKSFEPNEEILQEVIVLNDLYEFGPVKNTISEEAVAERENWWNNIYEGNENLVKYQPGMAAKDAETVNDLLRKLEEDPEEIIWIWAAQNSHDVSGYYWLISQLKSYQGRVFILYLNNLPFINEKNLIFYPKYLHQILPSEFRKARKLSRVVTLSEFETDPDEWEKLMKENKGIRILEGGKKLQQWEYEYFDKDILGLVHTDWLKLAKLLSQIQVKIYSGNDLFFLWRIRELIKQGKIDVQGDNKSLKDFEVKLRRETVSEAI